MRSGKKIMDAWTRAFHPNSNKLAPLSAGFCFQWPAFPLSFFSGNSQPAIDHFVMAITSLEAGVRHSASYA
jgi:hypothetical protein